LLAIDWLDAAPKDAPNVTPAGVLLLFPGIGTNSRQPEGGPGATKDGMM
jgi:hypothetical protein